MQKFKRVAVIAKPQGNISRCVRDLIDTIVGAGCVPCLDLNAAAHMPEDCPWETGPAEKITAVCDVAVAIGGDGTMLGAARSTAEHRIPAAPWAWSNTRSTSTACRCPYSAPTAFS